MTTEWRNDGTARAAAEGETNLARPGAAASRADLRTALVARREAMPEARRRAAQARIAAGLDDCLAALLEGRSAPVVALYVPHRSEPDLSAGLPAWRARGWTLALPRVVARQAPLEFGRWPAAGTLRQDRYGIPVPDPFDPVTPDLLVVPCVGFHADGWRLGYGGGYYDRTLAGLQVPAVGVAFEECRLDVFEPGEHDRRLDAVVTQARVHGA